MDGAGGNAGSGGSGAEAGKGGTGGLSDAGGAGGAAVVADAGNPDDTAPLVLNEGQQVLFVGGFLSKLYEELSLNL